MNTTATAKSLGFKKGDMIHTGLFPGIIIGYANTSTPLCEVWRIEHECGSVYAHDMIPLSWADFKIMVKAQGHELGADTKEAQAVIATHQSEEQAGA